MPKSRGILLPNGGNNSQTPVQLALLLQHGLPEVNQHDLILIAYHYLGHIVPLQPYNHSRIITPLFWISSLFSILCTKLSAFPDRFLIT
jgi:hypothetical protein